MKILLAFWFIFVLADGGAATLLTWEAFKKGGWRDHHSRYLGVLFCCFTLSRALRLHRILYDSPAAGLSQAWVWKAIAEATLEAVGMWSFYGYYMGKLDGTFQDRIGRGVVKLFRKRKR